MKYDFCYRDAEMTFIDVLIRVSVSRVLSEKLGLGIFPPHVEVAKRGDFLHGMHETGPKRL